MQNILPQQCSYDDYNPSFALPCKPLAFDCRIWHPSAPPAFSTMFIPFSSLITSHCWIKRSKAQQNTGSILCPVVEIGGGGGWGGGCAPPNPGCYLPKHIRASICHHLPHYFFSRRSSSGIHDFQKLLDPLSRRWSSPTVDSVSAACAWAAF